MHRLTCFVIALLASVAAAQQAQPTTRPAEPARALFDNDDARPIEINLGPGEKLPAKRWADRVVIELNRLTDPKQPVRGVAVWHEAGEQAFENTEKTPQKWLVLEIKPLVAAVMPKATPEGPDAMSACKTCSRLLLENERVRAYLVRLEPGEKQSPHVHPATLAYSLTPVELKFTLDDEKTSEKALPAGACAWNEPVKHSVENIGKQTAVFIHIEKKPAK